MSQHPVLHHVDVRCASCGTSIAFRSASAAISVDPSIDYMEQAYDEA